VRFGGDAVSGQEIRIFYLGPGQNPGDTFVLLSHERAIYSLGAFAKRSCADAALTPLGRKLDALLKVAAMTNVDKVLPAHGDVATHRGGSGQLAHRRSFGLD
jgi:hypothetical protein